MDRMKWLEWRRDGLGSSDAAALMDASPWKTRYDVYRDKVYGEISEQDNDAMKHGRDTEPMVREYLEDRFETFLEPRNIEHPSANWMRASIDAMSFCGKIAVEIKCPYRNRADHEMAKLGLIPEKYEWQLYHQMRVTGLDQIGYQSYFEGDFSPLIWLYLDREKSEKLGHVEYAFWHGNILRKKPPELTARDHREMDQNAQWEELTSKYSDCKTKADAYEKEQEGYKKKLIEIAEGKNARGKGMKLTVSECEGRIDYEKALKEYQNLCLELNPDMHVPHFDIEEYRKSSTLMYRLSTYKDVIRL